MPEARVIDDQDAIVYEIEIAAPPERVFQALTDQKQLFVWWGAEPAVELRLFEMDPRPGGRWRFECVGREGLAVNGVSDFEAHGVILEFFAPQRLVYTWVANWHDHPDRETVVSWELEPTPTGTRVQVKHSGLAQQHVARKDYAGGWPGVLQLLKNYLAK